MGVSDSNSCRLRKPGETSWIRILVRISSWFGSGYCEGGDRTFQWRGGSRMWLRATSNIRKQGQPRDCCCGLSDTERQFLDLPLKTTPQWLIHELELATRWPKWMQRILRKNGAWSPNEEALNTGKRSEARWLARLRNKVYKSGHSSKKLN